MCRFFVSDPWMITGRIPERPGQSRDDKLAGRQAVIEAYLNHVIVELGRQDTDTDFDVERAAH